MNREEILSKSRRENERRDEREQAVFDKSGQRAAEVGGLVCGGLILLDFLLKKEGNFGIWAVYLSMTGTMLLSKYFSLRKTHELVFGLMELGLAAVSVVLYAIRSMR